MDLQQQFEAYAADFELSYEDDDWSRLDKYFTAEASYDSGDGSDPAVGRPAVMEKLQGAVNGLDRKMQKRDLRIDSIVTNDDTVVVEWTVIYANEGLPMLEVHGIEFARFEGARIAELRDEIRADSMVAFGDWMQAHGGSL